MTQSRLAISPIGTCRIHTPLRKGVARYPIIGQTARNYGFVHTVSEALQQLRFMSGEVAIPPDIQTLVFRPGVAASSYAKPHASADLYIVELSSRKLLTVDNYPIQSNYTDRHFRDFFADRARSRLFWSMASPARMAERRAWLDQEPSFARLSTEDRALLARIMKQEQPDADIERGMREIADRVGSEKLVFVTHVDALTPANALIEQRHRLIETVRDIASRMNVPCYDPTPLMHEFGQSRALENGGLDLTHFTDAFSERLVADWYERFIAARMPPSLERNSTSPRCDTAESFDDARAIESAWNGGSILDASRRVRAMLRIDPAHADHRKLLAHMQSELGDYEGAIALLEADQDECVRDEETRQLLIRCHFGLGNHREALRLASSMLADEIATPELLRISAISATHLGDTQTALASWKRLFRMTHDCSEAASGALRLLEAAGNAGDAERWAEEVLDKLPSHDESFALLWKQKVDAGDRTALLGLTGERICLEAEALIMLAQRAAIRGFAMPAAALVASQNMLSDDDRKAVADWLGQRVAQWLTEGEAALAGGDLLVAADRIQAAGLIEPANRGVVRARREIERRLRQAARSAFVARNFASVMRIVDIAVETRIAFPGLDSLRGRAAFALGDTDTALHHLRRMANEPGAPVSAVLHLARVAVRSERYTEAIEAFSQIATNEEATPTLREGAARRIAMLRARSIRAARDMVVSGDFDGAWALLDLIARTDGEKPDVAVEKERVVAALRARLRGLDAASGGDRLAVGQAILKLVPNDPVGLKVAATGAMRLRRFALALDYWNVLRARSGDTDQIEANIRKCRLSIDRDKPKQAEPQH